MVFLKKRRRITNYKITLEVFLETEYIRKYDKNQDVIKNIGEIINEDRLHNPYYDYIITADTPIADIKKYNNY